MYLVCITCTYYDSGTKEPVKQSKISKITPRTKLISSIHHQIVYGFLVNSIRNSPRAKIAGGEIISVILAGVFQPTNRWSCLEPWKV